MGNTASSGASIISHTSSTSPQTPASSFFNNITVPTTKRRIRRSLPPQQHQQQPPPAAYPRRSIFAPDEHEPDDFTPHEGVLLGWTRTEQGIIIPQIRSLPLGTPLDFDDTIFNVSPRLPWMQHRSRSPVPSARSIPRLRQFSVESLRSVRKRELRVVNVSRPPTPATSIESVYDDEEEPLLSFKPAKQSLDWDAFPAPDEDFGIVTPTEEECGGDVTLKRGNSTNDSGYSTLIADDTASCSTASEDPWWWEEAAGYKDTSQLYESPLVSRESVQYFEHQRQESAYLSTLLRNQPFDEWAEWRTNVTQLLMIPEEEETADTKPPITPRSLDKPLPDVPKSPSRRRSLFNFAKKKLTIEKRRSVLW
jgi:hypothetical protein